jgi:hypothetical protein
MGSNTSQLDSTWLTFDSTDKLVICKKCDEIEVIFEKLEKSLLYKKCDECCVKVNTFHMSQCKHTILCPICFTKCAEYCDVLRHHFLLTYCRSKLLTKLGTNQDKVYTSIYAARKRLAIGCRDSIDAPLSKMWIISSECKIQHKCVIAFLCDYVAI